MQFLAICVKEAALAVPTFAPLLLTPTPSPSPPEFLSTFHLHLIEFPLQTLARSAQIKSNLWARNGHSMIDQHWNYSEPPFCRLLRDADLTAVQLGALAFIPDSKMCYFVNLVLHRFGAFTYFDLENAVLYDTPAYYRELTQNFFPPQHPPPPLPTLDSDDDAPSAFSPPPMLPTPPLFTTAGKDSDSENMRMVEEMLYLLTLLVTELPRPPTSRPAPPKSPPVAVLKKLRREIVHRLATGPSTHSSLNDVHLMLSVSENSALAEKVSAPAQCHDAALCSCVAAHCSHICVAALCSHMFVAT